MREHWEAAAAQWVLWAREPGHDAYWDFREAFFDQMVPPPGDLTLDVGCGEGRVTRDLAARGHRVVGLDGSPTLVRHARQADPAGRHVVADAARLPLRSGVADLVVSYNALMDVDDLAGSVREAARVLRLGGRLCVGITHPLGEVVAWHDEVPVLTEPYLDVRLFDSVFERDGLTMHFRGWARPLQDYAGALEDAGLLIERLREPETPPGRVASLPTRSPARRLPWFLWLRAVKPATPA